MLPAFDSVLPDLFAQALTIGACLIIVWRAEPVLNRMRRCTPMLLRMAFWLICVSAAASIIRILLGGVPMWPSVLGACGLALLLLCERRLRFLTRHPKELRLDNAR